MATARTPFLLDSGSTLSSVSRQLASRLDLPRTGSTTKIRGVVTSSDRPLVTIRSWKLGRYSLVPEQVVVLDLSKTAGSAAGLLGSDELRHFGAVTIDFRHRRLDLALP